MIRLAPTLSIYIGRHFLTHFAILMVVFLGLIYLIDAIELLRRSASREGVSALIALQMAFLKLPHLGQETFPFAVLFAGMSAFSRLTKSHELVVTRAAGVSAWRFMTPALLVAFGLGLFQIMVINPLGSAALSAFEQMESKHFDGRSSLLSLSANGLWLRQSNLEGQSVLHSRYVLQQGEHVDLNDVSIFVYKDADHFSHRIEADRASLEDGFWHLYNVQVHIVDKPTEYNNELWFETDLTLNKIQDSFAPPETMSFWSLPSFIDTMEKAGFSGKRHKLHWHSLLSAPFLLIAMVLIAATFTLRHTRKGGTTFVVSGGMLCGFVLYFFTDISMALALSGSIPVLLAAWAPASICLLLGSTMILHLEDG
ncbi:LPS export ABC transporter permease LptG [Terasakiella sp. A23]|uniref:LPS export ABC transporter permease LptG n=1 Tax=Terasakiella sp. FCG-A23 TaxID=3080561 RepID=UPI00295492F3|nr:LPS export ABC transporter permease LptG [Terasakiella sp. A23]MDV7340161.1 LPS export ABC transporter permease LptG [Terasakiella sp. A23]